MEWPSAGVVCDCLKIVERIDGDAVLARVKRSVDGIVVTMRHSLVRGCCVRKWHP